MNFEMENGKYRYINGTSNKILFVQEQSLSLDKKSESKVLTHEYVNCFLLRALMIFILSFLMYNQLFIKRLNFVKMCLFGILYFLIFLFLSDLYSTTAVV